MEASSAERRSEIYTYEAPHPVFAMNWSVSVLYLTRPDNKSSQSGLWGSEGRKPQACADAAFRARPLF